VPQRAQWAVLARALSEQQASLREALQERHLPASGPLVSVPMVLPHQEPQQPARVTQAAELPFPGFPAVSGELSPPPRPLSNWSAFSFQLRQTQATGR